MHRSGFSVVVDAEDDLQIAVENVEFEASRFGVPSPWRRAFVHSTAKQGVVCVAVEAWGGCGLMCWEKAR